MKKKITAAALALCLVLGLLPMSALAVQYKGTIGSGADQGTEITFDVNDETGAVSIAADPTLKNQYYLASPTTLELADRTDNVEFTINYYGEAPGTLTVRAAKVAQAIEDNTVDLGASEDPATGNVTTGVDEALAGEIGTSVEDTLTLDATTQSGSAAGTTTVTMPQAIVTAAVTARIDVRVETNVGAVTLPTAALEKAGGAARLTVKKETSASAPSGVSVAASISITLTGVTGTTVLETPIAVEIKTAVTNPIVAWLSGGHLYRMRTAAAAGGIKFFTRHLSDFVVVEEGAPVEPAPMDAEIGTVGSNSTFTVDGVEPGDTVIITSKVTVGGVTYDTYQAWTATGTPNVSDVQGTRVTSPRAQYTGAMSYDGAVTFSEATGFTCTGNLTSLMPRA